MPAMGDVLTPFGVILMCVMSAPSRMVNSTQCPARFNLLAKLLEMALPVRFASLMAPVLDMRRVATLLVRMRQMAKLFALRMLLDVLEAWSLGMMPLLVRRLLVMVVMRSAPAHCTGMMRPIAAGTVPPVNQVQHRASPPIYLSPSRTAARRLTTSEKKCFSSP